MAVIGDHRHRLAVVARQHALDRTSPVGLEGDPLADPELEQVRVGPHLLQEAKSLGDPMIEVDQFALGEPVDFDRNESLHLRRTG